MSSKDQVWLRRVLDAGFPHEVRLTDAHGGGESLLDGDKLSRLDGDGNLVPVLVESDEFWMALDGFSVTVKVHEGGRQR